MGSDAGVVWWVEADLGEAEMKQNFKIDYIGLTAAHFTTFPQTAQSAQIIRQNNFDLVDRASFVADTISSKATEKALESMKGGKVNVYYTGGTTTIDIQNKTGGAKTLKIMSYPINTKAYISVGSNIDAEKNIEKALIFLRKHVTITGISTFYRNKPLQEKDQSDYLNGVLSIITETKAAYLKSSVLRPAEDFCRRMRIPDIFAPRTMDLDLILFGEHIIRSNGMNIPDPDIYERAFIAFPLAELEPDLILPDTKKPIKEVRKSLSGKGLHPEHSFTQRLRRRIDQ